MARGKTREGAGEPAAAPRKSRRNAGAQQDERKLVEQLLTVVREKLSDQKFSVADLIRLLQYRRELIGDTRVKEIEIRWVEPSGTENASNT
jgi:hypothetical protein